MARLPRLTAPGFPHHLIQRGNNRQPIFVDEADCVRFLDDLAALAPLHGLAKHAMTEVDDDGELFLGAAAVANAVAFFKDALGHE